MKKVKVTSGDILRFPLCNNMGYAYAKYIDLRNFHNVNYPSMLKVFNYWTKTKDFDFATITQSSYLLQPILVAGILPTLKNGLWEVIGNHELTPDDAVINHFKTYYPSWAEETAAKKWYYVIDGDLKNKTEAEFENVKHLELWDAQGTGTIEIKVTMQILLKENLTVSDYFDLEKEKFNLEYQKALTVPLLSKLPTELQGKAKF